MAKQYEDARAQGLTVSYSVDEAVGIAVNQLMFVRRITRKELGQALGVSGPNAGRKLRGEVTWTMTDLMKAAELLDVEPTNLVPRRAKKDPALVAQGGIFDVVAGTGFEPVPAPLARHRMPPCETGSDCGVDWTVSCSRHGRKRSQMDTK